MTILRDLSSPRPGRPKNLPLGGMASARDVVMGRIAGGEQHARTKRWGHLGNPGGAPPRAEVPDTEKGGDDSPKLAGGRYWT